MLEHDENALLPGRPSDTLTPKRLTQVLRSHVPMLSQGQSLRPVLLTLILGVDFAGNRLPRLATWRALPATLALLRTHLMARHPSILYAIIAVEVHPGTKKKKKESKEPASKRKKTIDDQQESDQEPPDDADAAPAATGDAAAASTSPTKEKKNPLEGFPHLHIFVAQDVTCAPFADAHSLQRSLLELLQFPDVNIRTPVKINQQDWFQMLRYVLKGYQCPLVRAYLEATEQTDLFPYWTYLLLHPILMGRNSGQPHPMWAALSQWIQSMTKGGVGPRLTDVELYVHADDALMLTPPLSMSSKARVMFQVANYMRGIHHYIYRGFVYCEHQLCVYAVQYVSDTAKFLSSLTTDYNLASPVITYYEEILRAMPQYDIFPSVILDYDYVGFRQQMYRISDGSVHTFDTALVTLGSRGRVFRYFDVPLDCAAIPRVWAASVERHLVEKETIPYQVPLFCYEMAKLFRPRDRKAPSPFLVGKPDTGKSTLICWLREFFEKEDIATINTGGFPFSDFYSPRRLLLVEEMATNSCKRSDLLRILEGGAGICVEKKNKDAMTLALSCPAVFNGNHELKYHYKDSAQEELNDAVASRLHYFHTFNPIPKSLRDPQVEKDIKAEAWQILIFCNEKYLEHINRLAAR